MSSRAIEGAVAIMGSLRNAPSNAQARAATALMWGQRLVGVSDDRILELAEVFKERGGNFPNAQTFADAAHSRTTAVGVSDVVYVAESGYAFAMDRTKAENRGLTYYENLPGAEAEAEQQHRAMNPKKAKVYDDFRATPRHKRGEFVQGLKSLAEVRR